MSQKTIIITGASQGIGEATAQMAAELGANVVLSARSEARLRQAADAITKAGGQALAVVGDISRPEVCEQIVDETVKHFGSVESIIHNAGTMEPFARIKDADPDVLMQGLAVNLVPLFSLTQAALPYLRASKGRVIHISSGVSKKPTVGQAAYCMAKAAVNIFTGTLALEEPDITTLAIRPGGVNTPMFDMVKARGADVMDPELFQYYAKRELLAPEVPGRVLALLALYAPHEWSGEYLSYDDPKVQELVAQYE